MMLNNSVISSTRGTYVYVFLKQNIGKEYSAQQIANQISFPSTSHQVAAAIKNMRPWEKRHIHINDKHNPFRYSFK